MWPTAFQKGSTPVLEHAGLQICEPAPFIYYENGQLAVTDGASVWLVIVTCEAMKATADPLEKSLRRLVRYAGFYRDLAEAVVRRGEDVDGKVWVTEAIVRSATATSIELPSMPSGDLRTRYSPGAAGA